MKKIILLEILLTGIIFLLYAGQLSAKSWKYQKTDVRYNLTSIDFVDSTTGWAVGENGVILSTKDGGETWKNITPNILNNMPEFGVPGSMVLDFYSLYFMDREKGCIAGELQYLIYKDGQIVPYPVSCGIILVTDDGGQTWKCQYPCTIWNNTLPPDRIKMGRINDIFFFNSKYGWAVGNGFYYLVTEDGGRTWQEKSLGFWAIPEVRHTLTSTKWISLKQGWVSGYQYDMFYPERKTGFIARTEDGGETWNFDPFYPPSFAPVPALMDLEILKPQINIENQILPAWAVGTQGSIFQLGADGWEMQSLIWPLCLPYPEFNSVRFADDNHGWIVGWRNDGFGSDGTIPRQLMSILYTSSGGEEWQAMEWGEPGRLNDIDLIGFTDAWAAGEDGKIIHYHNNSPEICFQNSIPQTVYAGDSVEFTVFVKDLDGNDDIKSITMDAGSIGAGIVTLLPEWQTSGDRRCLAYYGKAMVSPLASYGMHNLFVKAIDNDGASDSTVMDLFVITSWVDIDSAWAYPNPAGMDDKILLSAKVDIIVPKTEGYDENNTPYNKIKKVSVNITQLLQVDCTPDMDCIMIVDMTDPDGDGIYTYVVKSFSAMPGKYELPVTAVDTLGHKAQKHIMLQVSAGTPCRFNATGNDNDVDGEDLAYFARVFPMIDGGGVNLLKLFAKEFGSIDCI